MQEIYMGLTKLITNSAEFIWSYMLFILFAVGAWVDYKNRLYSIQTTV
ncbi:MAG TPA: hypothetical protein VFG01_07875 [Acidobacteriota bacterium]|nr:hypothetical protein [Acidobacteriota bacterium]